MPDSNPGAITELLRLARQGDKEAENHLFELLLPDLRHIANRVLHRKYRGHTLEASDLVNTACRRLRPDLKTYSDSAHFKAYAATCMLHYLLDRARKALPREKAVGHQVPFEQAEDLPLHPDDPHLISRSIEYLALGRAIDELRRSDKRAADIVIYKLAGMTNHEIAEVLGVDESTVKRDWRSSRAAIAARLDSRGPSHRSRA